MDEQRHDTVTLSRSKVRRRILRFEAIQHLVPSFALITAGFEALHEVPLLGVFQIFAAGLMLVIAIRELMPGHHEKEGAAVRWADLFASAMLLAEALHLVYEGKRYVPYVYLGLSIVLAVRAYLWKSILGRRKMREERSR